MEIEITEASKEVFRLYAKDAGNWSGGCGWVSDGNIDPTKEQRGNLGDLVKKGLVKITGDKEDNPSGTGKVLHFTEAGVEFAKMLGIDLTWVDIWEGL